MAANYRSVPGRASSSPSSSSSLVEFPEASEYGVRGENFPDRVGEKIARVDRNRDSTHSREVNVFYVWLKLSHSVRISIFFSPFSLFLSWMRSLSFRTKGSRPSLPSLRGGEIFIVPIFTRDLCNHLSYSFFPLYLFS